MRPKKRKPTPFPLPMLIISVAVWILFLMLQWVIVAMITDFLIFPLMVICFVTVAVICIIALIKTIRCWRYSELSRNSWLRLIIIVVFLASFFLPLDDVYERARFKILAPAFDNAAHEALLADTGKYTHYVVSLPLKYASLSRGGGEVIVDGDGDSKIVFFFTYRGFFDGASTGFAYASDAQANEELQQNKSYRIIAPLQNNWYFCDHIT